MDTTTTHAWLPSQPNSTFNAPWPIFYSHPADGRRLSWPGWLVTNRDDIHNMRMVTHLSTNQAADENNVTTTRNCQARYSHTRQMIARD